MSETGEPHGIYFIQIMKYMMWQYWGVLFRKSLPMTYDFWVSDFCKPEGMIKLSCCLTVTEVMFRI